MDNTGYPIIPNRQIAQILVFQVCHNWMQKGEGFNVYDKLVIIVHDPSIKLIPNNS
jgi:hypothetical protein